MKQTSAERGVSEILGSILVFALVLAVLILVQVFAVPAANAQVEFEHSTNVEAEVGEVGASFDRLATTGGSETLTIDAGLNYPPRIFLLNPSPASYTFAASPLVADGVNVTNLSTASIDAEADEYISDERSGTLSYDARSYTLETGYSQYQNAPSYTIEGGVLYKRFDNGAVSFLDTGSVIDGRSINLVVLDGALSQGGSGSLNLQTTAVSTATRPITVENRSDGPITVRLATGLDQTDWEDLLDGQPIDNVDVENGVAKITLEPGAYDLRITRIQIGPGTESPDTAYLTAPDGNVVPVSGDATRLSVEARDEYNNPLSRANVTFEANGSGSFNGSNSVTVRTDERGQATVRFEPNRDGSVVAFSGTVDSGASEKRVLFEIDVLSDGAGPDEDRNEINPFEDDLVLTGGRPIDLFGSPKDDSVELRFRNTDSSNIVLSGARVNFYFTSKPGGDKGPETARLEYGGTNPSEQLVIGRDVIPIGPETFQQGPSTDTLTVTFYDNVGDPYEIQNTDEFFVLTLVFEDRPKATYFVQPIEFDNE
jgi:hypothetical protein